MTTAPTGLDFDRVIETPADEVWYTRCPVPTAFEVALGTGLFDREFGTGRPTWHALADSPDPAVHQSHFTHRKARSFRHGGNVPAIYARSRGADTRVIGVSWLPTPYPILALPESGITSVADLAGRRLLLPRRPHAAIDFWAASTLGVYESALATEGLSLSDVTLVERVGAEHLIPGAEDADVESRQRWTLRNAYTIQRDILVPLVRREVDAVTSQASLVTPLEGLSGARVIFDQADHPDLIGRVNNGYPDTLTVSGALVDEDLETVARVVARLLQAAAWARDAQGSARALIADRVQVTSAVLDATWGEDIGAKLGVDLPEMTEEVLRRQHDHLLRHRFIDSPFDVGEWIDPRPLGRAREILASGDLDG